jgi:hypothetical protein
MATKRSRANPSWWKDEHETGWQRIKHLVKDEWRKLKAKPDASETSVKSAPPTGWGSAEPAMRFGYGAGLHYGVAGGRDWQGAETQLQKDWEALGSGREWQHARADVKHGWESHTRHITPDVASTQVRGAASGFGENPAGDSGSGTGVG